MYHPDDFNHLHGTPIPREWTRNHGRNLRPLEVGMEVRLHEGTTYLVRGVTNCGANVGAIVISTYAEIDYRRAEGVAQVDARARRKSDSPEHCAIPIPVSFLYRDESTWFQPPHCKLPDEKALDRALSPDNSSPRPRRLPITRIDNNLIGELTSSGRYTQPPPKGAQPMYDGNDEYPPEEPTIPAVAPSKPTNDIEALKERKRLKLRQLAPQTASTAPAVEEFTREEVVPKKSAKTVVKPKEQPKLTPKLTPKLKPVAVPPIKKVAAKKTALPVPRAKGKAATSIKRAVEKGKKPAPVVAKKAAPAKVSKARKATNAKLKKVAAVLNAKPKKVLSARAKAIIAKAAKRSSVPLKAVAPSTGVSRKGKALKAGAPGTSKGEFALPRKYRCMCCNKPCTGKYFARGHVWAYKRAIEEALSGQTMPEKSLPSWVVKAMGPWTKVKGGGVKPAVANYEKVYAIANAKS